MTQKDKDVKIALAMIVKSADEEVVPFSRALANISPFVDGIFITVTHKKGEEPHKDVVKIAESFKATISHYEWTNHFANARNYNFSQVPEEYDYILWADADDVFENLDKLKATLETHNGVDGLAMNYIYSRDEYGNADVVHLKTQVIRNDGCVEWKGKIHEDFKEKRALEIKLVKDITRIHLTNEKRINIATRRNLEIAEDDMKQKPDDPRSYWNLGNALKGVGEFEKSTEVFKKFVEMSDSEEEKYIAFMRIGENYFAFNDIKNAVNSFRLAIGLRPQYPDAYVMLGEVFRINGDYMKAIEMYKMGLSKEPPYEHIIVFNPRQYDYIPMIGIAKSYFALNLPNLAMPMLEGCLEIYPKNEELQKMVKIIKKEADKVQKILDKMVDLSHIKSDKIFKEEYDKLPGDMKNHPAIIKLKNTRLVKEKSSGKDIAIFCGYTGREWTPEALKEGIGGSEEAVIHLSKRLSKAGWNVEVYNNCGHKDLEFDGVKYKPFYTFNIKDKQDIVVLWRTPKLVDYDINADKIFIDVHDTIAPDEFNKKRLKKIDKIFVKSKFHRSLYENVPDNKIVVVSNGIEADKFIEKEKRDPYLIINTSSPDRSMTASVQLFRRIKKLVPKARMIWAYGFDVFNIGYSGDAEKMSWKEDLIKQMKDAGIENLGRISHEEVRKLYNTANVMLYPSEFAEIDMISLSKAMAGGTIPVTTDFAAMGEKAKYGVFLHSKKTKDNWADNGMFDFSIEDNAMKDEMVKKVVDLLKNPPTDADREEMREWARQAYDWDKVAKVWLDNME